MLAHRPACPLTRGGARLRARPRAPAVRCCAAQAPAGPPAARRALASLASLASTAALPALAYTPAVDSAGVGEVVQTVAGVLFTAAASAFLLRLVRRRASRATNVRLVAAQRASPRRAEGPPPSAASCFVGAAFAAVLAVALWTFSGWLDGVFEDAPPSDQYAVRNVSATLRSILTGLSYLATFLFGANAVGLSGLGVQTLLGGGGAAAEGGGGGAGAAEGEGGGEEER